MPAPNPETRAIDPLRKRRKRLRYDVIAGLLGGILLTVLIRNNMHKAQTIWKSSTTVHELPLENVAQERFSKECVTSNNKKCKEYIQEGSNTQRVAVVSPPGLLATALERMVDHATQRASKGDYEFVRTSHVPPYGYGKTHGLTKIVRLVPHPLILGVTDMLLNRQDPVSFASKLKVSLSDLKVTLRQLLRFHCRISHVSAHTALLTIPLSDMILNPDQVVDQLSSFLGADSEQQPQRLRSAMEKQQTRKELKEETTTILRSIRSHALTLLSQVEADDVLEVLGDVLRHELQSTKNLTDWPCQSFWSAGEDPDPFSLSPESKRIAAALSPNCSLAYSNCWVARDLCEAKGDGPCKEK